MAETAFVFSGQGAQAPGMMKEYYQRYPEVRAIFDLADDVLGRRISQLCFNGTQEELDLTHNTQPCVLAADLAAYEIAKIKGLQPDGMAGFSLGEYAALAAAGVFSLADAFRIVQLRADAMQSAVPAGKGCMAAIMKTEEPVVQELCDEVDGFVVPANYNSPVQIVVAGETSAVDELLGACKNRKIRAMKIAVSAPFHCKMMEPASKVVRDAVSGAALNEPSVPVYLNVTAEPLNDIARLPDYLAQQAMRPVRWMQTLENMSRDGFNTFVECGPGATLSGFVGKTLPDAKAYSATML